MIIDQLASVIRFAIEDLDAVQVETDHEEIIKDDLVIKNEIYKCEGLRKLHLEIAKTCLLYTSPSPRDATLSRMPSSA